MPKLTLEQALHLAEAARKKGRETGIGVTVAIVDTAGRTVLIHRGDGTGYLTPETSRAKAMAAAAFGKSTKELVDLQKTNPAFWQALPTVTEQPVLPSTGAVPIVMNNEIIGAIGCAGGTPDQDHTCAIAGAYAIKPSQNQGS